MMWHLEMISFQVRASWFLNIVSVLLAIIGIMLDAFVRPAEGTAAGSIQLLACRSPPKTETAADEWNCNRIGGTTNQRQKEQATAIATAIIADPHPRLPFLLKLTGSVGGVSFFWSFVIIYSQRPSRRLVHYRVRIMPSTENTAAQRYTHKESALRRCRRRVHE